jgi:hypothetical protein
MKISHLSLGLAAWIFTSSGLMADPIEITLGERKESVLQALGPPNGHLGSAGFEVYYFDRGEVSFRHGRLASHTLISEEQLRARQRAAEHERRARAEAESAHREAVLQEGLELREQMLTDPAFATLPAADRLVFWQSFRQLYPSVDVDFQHLVASRQAAQEAARSAENKRQIEADQQRLRQLELRLAEAERQAQLAERRSRSQYYSPSGYTSYHSPYRGPVVVVHTHPHASRGNKSPPTTTPKYPETPQSQSGPSAIDQRGLTFDQRAIARQKEMENQWEIRQKAFDDHGSARERAFQARWDAVRTH